MTLKLLVESPNGLRTMLPSFFKFSVEYLKSFNFINIKAIAWSKTIVLHPFDIHYRAVQDLGFYETRRILKFSFKHCLMKEIEIFFNLAWTGLYNIYFIISFKTFFYFLSDNLIYSASFHEISCIKQFFLLKWYLNDIFWFKQSR